MRLVILIGGQGTNACAILQAIAEGRLDAQCLEVISHRKDAPGIEHVKALDANVTIIDDRDYADRTSFEKALGERIDSLEPELIALAGFMRVLSDNFVLSYPNKIINIHPSLLPKYKGLNTHQKAIEAGDTIHGASIHWVTPELDSGPVIAQQQVPVIEGDTASSLKQRVQSIEHELYIKTLMALSNKTVIQNSNIFEENQS